MYVIPIVALMLVIAIGVAWSPIFAVIIVVPLFLLFLAYVGFSRQTDQRADQAGRRPSGEPASGEGSSPR